MKILVVDDDGLAGALTSALLEDLGHEILQAENGLEAMEVLDADPSVDLIVSDLHMPLVSGLELFAELRAQGSRVPFFLLSGDDPAALGAREPALDGCLAKDGNLGAGLARALEALGARGKHHA